MPDTVVVNKAAERDGAEVAGLIHKAESTLEAHESRIKSLESPWVKTSEGQEFMEKWRKDLESAFEKRLEAEKKERDDLIEKKTTEIDELKNIIIRQNQGATSAGPGNIEEKANAYFEKAIMNMGRAKKNQKPFEIKQDEIDAYMGELKSDIYATPELDQKAVANTMDYRYAGALTLTPKIRTGIVDVALREPTNIGQYCEQHTIPMESIEILTQPVHGTAGWQRELGERTELPGIEVAAKKYSLHGCYTRYGVTYENLRYARIPILSWMRRDFTQGFGVLWGQSQINGDGVGKPLGLLNTPGIPTFQQGAATIADFDALKKMRYQIKSPHRVNLKWTMSRLVRAELDVIQDENKRYYLGDNVAGQSGETLFGYPIIFSEDMPQIAQDAKPILLGNFSRSCVSLSSSQADIMIEDRFTQATKGIILYYMYTFYGFGTYNTEPLIFLVLN